MTQKTKKLPIMKRVKDFLSNDFVCLIWFFTSHQQSKLGWMCLAQGPQGSDAGKARTCGPSVSSQALYLWATAVPFFCPIRFSRFPIKLWILHANLKQWRSQNTEKYAHQRETTGSSSDSLHLHPFSKWELLLKERISPQRQLILSFKISSYWYGKSLLPH